jgi:hypothetical protein
VRIIRARHFIVNRSGRSFRMFTAFITDKP